MANFKKGEIIAMCETMSEGAKLKHPHIVVPCDEVEKYVNFANFFGVILHGGALLEGNRQVLYWD